MVNILSHVRISNSAAESLISAIALITSFNHEPEPVGTRARASTPVAATAAPAPELTGASTTAPVAAPTAPVAASTTVPVVGSSTGPTLAVVVGVEAAPQGSPLNQPEEYQVPAPGSLGPFFAVTRGISVGVFSGW